MKATVGYRDAEREKQAKVAAHEPKRKGHPGYRCFESAKLLLAVTLIVAVGMPMDVIAGPPTDAIAEPPTDAIAEPPTDATAEPPAGAVVEMPVGSSITRDHESDVESEPAVAVEVDEAMSSARKREATYTKRRITKSKKLIIAGGVLAGVGANLLVIGALGWVVVDNSIWGDEDDSPGYVVTTGLMITGGVLALAGASLAITGAVMRRRQRQAQIAVLPTFGASTAGVVLSGRF